MGISIRGIRIKSLSITPSPDDSEEKISGEYQLISTADKVLANQTVGGYNGMKLTPSPTTQKALDEFISLYRKDIELLLGLDAE